MNYDRENTEVEIDITDMVLEQLVVEAVEALAVADKARLCPA